MLLITLLLTFAVKGGIAISSVANVSSSNQHIAKWKKSKSFLIDVRRNLKPIIPSICLIVVGFVGIACQTTIR